MTRVPRARGRCLCGAISFQVFGPLRDVYNCHCGRCRRFTGHHMAATATDLADLDVDDPDSNLRWYFPVEQSGYGFCSECGSSLFWRSRATPARISICAGTLEPPTGIRTVQAWWTSEASDYHDRLDTEEFATE